MKSNAIKKDDNVSSLSEYKGFQALQKADGRTSRLTKEKL